MKIDEAICELNNYLSKRKITYTKLDRHDTAIETVLKENKKLKEMLISRIKYTNELEKDLFENVSNYVVSKDKIRAKIEELKYESWHIKDCKFNKLQEKIYNAGILFGKNIVLQELLKESN